MRPLFLLLLAAPAAGHPLADLDWLADAEGMVGVPYPIHVRAVAAHDLLVEHPVPAEVSVHAGATSVRATADGPTTLAIDAPTGPLTVQLRSTSPVGAAAGVVEAHIRPAAVGLHLHVDRDRYGPEPVPWRLIATHALTHHPRAGVARLRVLHPTRGVVHAADVPVDGIAAGVIPALVPGRYRLFVQLGDATADHPLTIADAAPGALANSGTWSAPTVLPNGSIETEGLAVPSVGDPDALAFTGRWLDARGPLVASVLKGEIAVAHVPARSGRAGRFSGRFGALPVVGAVRVRVVDTGWDPQTGAPALGSVWARTYLTPRPLEIRRVHGGLEVHRAGAISPGALVRVAVFDPTSRGLPPLAHLLPYRDHGGLPRPQIHRPGALRFRAERHRMSTHRADLERALVHRPATIGRWGAGGWEFAAPLHTLLADTGAAAAEQRDPWGRLLSWAYARTALPAWTFAESAARIADARREALLGTLYARGEAEVRRHGLRDVEPALRRDPWGYPVQLRRRGRRIDVVQPGPDGRVGTGDDRVSADIFGGHGISATCCGEPLPAVFGRGGFGRMGTASGRSRPRRLDRPQRQPAAWFVARADPRGRVALDLPPHGTWRLQADALGPDGAVGHYSTLLTLGPAP